MRAKKQSSRRDLKKRKKELKLAKNTVKTTTGSELAVKEHHPKAFKKKHHKPYRLRHVGLLTVSLAVLFVLSALAGAQWVVRDILFPKQTVTSVILPNTNTLVASSYGFSIPVDLNRVDVQATALDGEGNSVAVKSFDSPAPQKISNVTAKLNSSGSSAAELTSEFYFTVATSDADKTNVNGSLEKSSELFEVASDDVFNVELTGSSETTVGGLKFIQDIYKRTNTLGPDSRTKGVSTYIVQWSGIVDGRPVAFGVDGLVTQLIPQYFVTMIDNMKFSEVQYDEVLGATTLDTEQIADYASPAVVKVYYGICTDLQFEGRTVLEQYCNAGSGSGFFISNEGHIATNGHVVITEPVDVFIEFLLSDVAIFASYLQSLGVSSSDAAIIINNTALIASEVSYIYDEYDKGNLDFTFANKKEAINIALSDSPLQGSDKDIEAWINDASSDDVMPAELIGYDYSAGDATRALDTSEDTGYENSDVALLKVDVQNAPVLELFEGSITSNQKILVVGFPGNAENELVKQDKLSITTTNGSVSSIREASGSRQATVYQSDVAASAGNSGGPALTEEGEVFGLLTYSYLGEKNTDSRISYIRDIADLKELVKKEGVELKSESTTQDTWEKGLSLYSESRLSKSIKEFEKVKELYPSHRLADVYIANAQKGIEAGNDVKDFPFIIIGIVTLLALGGLTVGVVLVVRHRKHHENFKHVENHNALVGAGVAPSLQPTQGLWQQQAPIAPGSPVQQPAQAPTPPVNQNSQGPIQPPQQQAIQQPVQQQPVAPQQVVVEQPQQVVTTPTPGADVSAQQQQVYYPDNK